MKKANIIFIAFLFCLLCTIKTNAQSCSGGPRGASCSVTGIGQTANGAWEMTSPTGYLRYTLSAECSSIAYSSEAIIWGITFNYVIATPQSQVAYVDQTVSGLDTNQSYWVEMQTQTSGPSYSSAAAYATVYTW